MAQIEQLPIPAYKPALHSADWLVSADALAEYIDELRSAAKHGHKHEAVNATPIDPAFPVMSKAAFAANIGVSASTVDGWMIREWVRGREYIVKGRTSPIVLDQVREWFDHLISDSKALDTPPSKRGQHARLDISPPLRLPKRDE